MAGLEKGMSTESRVDLDAPIEADVIFKFVSVPLPEEVHVFTLPMWTDGKGSMDYFDEYRPHRKAIVSPEDLDKCYFSMNQALMEAGKQPTHVLPKGFYCNEFLKMNPLDIQEFLFFQRKYGRITGARKRKPYGTDMRELLRPEPDGDLFSGCNKKLYSEQVRGIEASQAIFDTVPDEEYVEESILNRLGAVSFREAIAAVLDAQSAVKSLLRVQRDDLGTMTKREAVLAKEASDYASHFLAKTVRPFQLVIKDRDPVPVYDLIDGVFVQLARGLLKNDTYRICANPECNRVFTPREMGRRLDTKYCCSDCQERAKRLRYISAHSRARTK